VSGWVTFTSKSGFSFSYPQGWYVMESVGVHQAINAPAVNITVYNINTADLPPKSYVVPGGMGISLGGHVTDEPTGVAIPFLVGMEHVPGQQYIYSGDDPRLEPQFRGFLERRIDTYFTAGKWRWAMSCAISPPAQGLDKYTEICYQVVRSLRYAAQ